MLSLFCRMNLEFVVEVEEVLRALVESAVRVSQILRRSA